MKKRRFYPARILNRLWTTWHTWRTYKVRFFEWTDRKSVFEKMVSDPFTRSALGMSTHDDTIKSADRAVELGLWTKERADDYLKRNGIVRK